MSTTYITAPPPTGLIHLNTTSGPLEIYLYSKESPLHCRRFVNLLQDGYYTNNCGGKRKVFFHRCVKNFIIQCGGQNGVAHVDPLNGNTITSSESKRILAQEEVFLRHQTSLPESYRDRYMVEREVLEKHSRLKFTTRGYLAFAKKLDNDKTLDNSVGCGEFFITLEESVSLDKDKYSIFAAVKGGTVFNCLRIGKAICDVVTTNGDDDDEREKSDKDNEVINVQPEDGVSLLSYEIIEHPFPADANPPPSLTSFSTLTVPWSEGNLTSLSFTSSEGDVIKARKNKRKGVKNVNVLSFGGDDEDGDGVGGGFESSAFKIKGGAHDFEVGGLEGKIDVDLSAAVAGAVQDKVETKVKKAKEKKSKKIKANDGDENDSKDDDEEERERTIRAMNIMKDNVAEIPPNNDENDDSVQPPPPLPSQTAKELATAKIQKRNSATNERLLKSKPSSTSSSSSTFKTDDVGKNKTMYSEVEVRRSKYLERKRGGGEERDETAFRKMEEFQERLKRGKG